MRVTTSQFEISSKNQAKRFPSEHNLPVRGKENKLLEQAAFWHEVKVVCYLPIPILHR